MAGATLHPPPFTPHPPTHLPTPIPTVIHNDHTQTTGIGAGKAANIKNCELCARKIAEVADTPKVKTPERKRGRTRVFVGCV